MTPTAVLNAFAPDTAFDLTLEAALLLEALDCAIITGTRQPGLRDTLLALLALTDYETLKAARRKGTVESLLETAARGRTPGELFALGPQIAAAIQAATAPAALPDPNDDTHPDSPEKKSSPASAGG